MKNYYSVICLFFFIISCQTLTHINNENDSISIEYRFNKNSNYADFRFINIGSAAIYISSDKFIFEKIIKPNKNEGIQFSNIYEGSSISFPIQVVKLKPGASFTKRIFFLNGKKEFDFIYLKIGYFKDIENCLLSIEKDSNFKIKSACYYTNENSFENFSIILKNSR